MARANNKQRVIDAKINTQDNIVELDVQSQVQAAQTVNTDDSIRQIAVNTTAGLNKILAILSDALAKKTP